MDLVAIRSHTFAFLTTPPAIMFSDTTRVRIFTKSTFSNSVHLLFLGAHCLLSMSVLGLSPPVLAPAVCAASSPSLPDDSTSTFFTLCFRRAAARALADGRICSPSARQGQAGTPHQACAEYLAASPTSILSVDAVWGRVLPRLLVLLRIAAHTNHTSWWGSLHLLRHRCTRWLGWSGLR